MSRLRTLLILGRVSNLPTIWSNCLAGWWLSSGGNLRKLPLLLAGTTLLYVGGMFLNDAFDADFDRQFRRSRPIPSGAISVGAVWRWGIAWLALGLICLACLGVMTGILGAMLVLCILIYDAVHKWITFAPVLMGACRFLVYLIAASIGAEAINGWAVWCGLALMLYVIGLSCLARGESTRSIAQLWPLALLVAPIVLALFMNVGRYRQSALLLSAVVALWIARSLRPALWSEERNVGRAVSNLLAGIVLIDLLAVNGASWEQNMTLLLLFGAALLAQKVVPAT
jgi:4-hydroxybenzoate polyprenyltransferase